MKTEAPNTEHETCFKELKNTISKETCLQYFDRLDNLELEVDSSLKGLGAALIQKG